MLFLVDDSSSMRLSQNLERNFPTFMTRWKTSPAACPTSTSPSSRPTWARATARSRCVGSGKDGIFQYTARGSCAPAPCTTPLQAGATYISTSTAPELHRPTGGRVHLHRGDRRERLRLRAPVRVDPARARRRRQRPPRENQGFLRPDAYLAIIMITNEDDCSRRRRRAAVRHLAQHPRQPARPALELPLQRVRPPLRRRAPQPQRAGQHGDRDDELHQLHLERRQGYSSVVDTAGGDQGAQVRSGQPDHRRGDHRRAADNSKAPAPTSCAGRRRHAAGPGRSSRTLHHARQQLSPTRRPHQQFVRQFGGNGLLCRSARTDFAPC